MVKQADSGAGGVPKSAPADVDSGGNDSTVTVDAAEYNVGNRAEPAVSSLPTSAGAP